MQYREYIEPIQQLPFIGNPERADAAAKAVLGILASRLHEDSAERLTRGLPEPLTFERLRSHQARPVQITVDEYRRDICDVLGVDPEQAGRVIETVLHEAKQALGDGALEQVNSELPADWSELIDRA
jgi:uncharacterized protein (DUF2267 family)